MTKAGYSIKEKIMCYIAENNKEIVREVLTKGKK